MRGENPSALTPREIDVIDLIVEGHTNESIASQLEISHWTVKVHVLSILRKLQCMSRLELAVNILNQRHAAEIESLRKEAGLFNTQSN